MDRGINDNTLEVTSVTAPGFDFNGIGSLVALITTPLRFSCRIVS
jgi:hypothetical protein